LIVAQATGRMWALRLVVATVMTVLAIRVEMVM
jgi:hypothetical protein